MLKAIWQVTAEVIPGQPVDELTRVWQYTSEDALKDAEVPKGRSTIFANYVQAAGDYAMSLQDPFHVNIINLKFTWL